MTLTVTFWLQVPRLYIIAGMLKSSGLYIQELVRSVDSEAELLINMERSAGQGRGGKTLKEEGCTQPTARPLPSKPFVITREMLKVTHTRTCTHKIVHVPAHARVYVCVHVHMLDFFSKAKVYGAGYPSVPSISLEEFYQQEYSKQQATKQRWLAVLA